MRWIRALVCLLALDLAGVACGAEEPADYDLHDISLWIADLAHPGFNTTDRYSSALPAKLAHSKRPRASVAANLFRPWGLITFWGQPATKLDLELRIKKGEFLDHWLPGEVRSNRLHWTGIEVGPSQGDYSVPIEPQNVLHVLRGWNSLAVSTGPRRERFLAYDCQLDATAPLKLVGRAEHYSLENLTDAPLDDIVVFIPDREQGQVAFVGNLPAKQRNAPTKATTPAKNDKPDEQPAVSGDAALRLAPGTKSNQAQVRKQLVARWRELGLTADEAKLLDEQVGRVFDQREVLVLCRLPASWCEERLRLLAFPEPRTTVRVAMLLVRNASPVILDDAERLAEQLGSPRYEEREAAERRLQELGQLALPALKQALKSKDAEIVYRAERIQHAIDDHH